MNVRRCTVAALAAAMLTGAAAGTPTVEDQMAVMQAQLELLRKQLEVRQARTALAGSQSIGLPTVVSVTIGARSVARLQLANGLTSYYSVGDPVVAGMQVASITPQLVTVSIGHGKAATQVPLEFEAPQRPGHGRPAGEPQALPPALLPPLPPVPFPTAVKLPALPRSQAQSTVQATQPASPTPGEATPPAPGSMQLPVPLDPRAAAAPQPHKQ